MNVNEESIIVNFFNEKYSLRKIEKLTGVSYYTIVKLLTNKGLYIKSNKPRKKWTIDLCEQLVHERGGENAHCLSPEYKNKHTKMLWKCQNINHKPFEAELNSIDQKKSWCPTCWQERKSQALTIITIEDCKDEAIKRGGVCLSTKYKNGEKLKFVCKYNHTFYRTWNEVHQLNRWCDDKLCCKTYRNQEICRQIFQSIFNKEFRQVNLSELNIPGSGKLQYDGYNDELKLAFEYNGKFHYEKVFENQDLEQQKKTILKKQN